MTVGTVGFVVGAVGGGVFGFAGVRDVGAAVEVGAVVERLDGPAVAGAVTLLLAKLRS